MFCKQCGTKMDDDARFCSVCGTKVGNANKQSAVSVEPPQKAQIETGFEQKELFNAEDYYQPSSMKELNDREPSRQQTPSYASEGNAAYGTAYREGTRSYEQSVEQNAEKDRCAGELFKWGLLGLIFADTGILSLLGWIFSAKAKRMAQEYAYTYGELKGRAQVGSIFAKIGFILGMVLTIFFAVYFSILFMAVLGSLGFMAVLGSLG